MQVIIFIHLFKSLNINIHAYISNIHFKYTCIIYTNYFISFQSWLAGLNGLEGFLEQVFSSNKVIFYFRYFFFLVTLFIKIKKKKNLLTFLINLFFLSLILIKSKTHPNFRIFISSEPPPLPEMKIIPESILQGAIKIANEAPQFLKANLRRAYAKFD